MKCQEDQGAGFKQQPQMGTNIITITSRKNATKNSTCSFENENSAENMDINNERNSNSKRKTDTPEIVVKQRDVQVLEISSLPEPPDGGWGWMVCLGSFMGNILLFPIFIKTCYSSSS